MIDICMALDQSVSPHTGVRTIQNTGVFWQAVFQPPRPYSLFFGTRLRRQNGNLAPTQYRQLRRLPKILRSSLSLEIMRSTHPAGHRKLLMSSSRRSDTVVLYEVGERKKNKEDERALTPNHTPSFFLCLLTSLSPRKKQKHLFHSLSIASRFRLQNRSQFFLRFSRHHCEADLERETRAMHGEQVLQAIKEIKNIK